VTARQAFHFPLTYLWLHSGDTRRFRIAVVARHIIRNDMWTARRRVKELFDEEFAQ
jgi:hypothetical protein